MLLVEAGFPQQLAVAGQDLVDAMHEHVFVEDLRHDLRPDVLPLVVTGV